MVQLDFYKNKRQGNANFGKVYARAKNAEPIDIGGLADHMSEHNTVFSKGVIRGLLTDMVKCIRELALMGQPVKLDDLCIISAQVTSTPADDVESFEIDQNITTVRLRFSPCGESAHAKVNSEALLKYTSLATRIKAGELTLSNEKGKYLDTTDGNVNP